MPKVAEEWPWSYVINDLCLKDYCHYCVRSCSDQLICSGCSYAVYCSNTCQNKAWIDHRKECTLIARMSGKIPCTMVRLMARIVIKLNTGGAYDKAWFSTVLKSFQKRSFTDLMSHKGKVFKDPVRAGNFAQYCYMLREYMLNERLPSSVGLMEIYGKVVVNAFTISNNDMNPVGMGIYLHLSQLDHACDAENVVIFDGAKAYLNSLSLKAINVEADLRGFTISYDSIIVDTETRRRNLQNRYYFTCHCNRCLDVNMDAIATSTRCVRCEGRVLFDEVTATGKCDLCKTVVEGLWKAVKLMVKCNKENDMLEDGDPRQINNETFYNQAQELLKREIDILHPMNVHVIRTKCFVAHAAQQTKRYDKAIHIYSDLRRYFLFYLPKNHPLIAINDLSIGRLLQKQDKWLLAKRHYAQALKVLKYSHGMVHPLYKFVNRLLVTCMYHLKKMDITEPLDKGLEAERISIGKKMEKSEGEQEADDDSDDENESVVDNSE